MYYYFRTQFRQLQVPDYHVPCSPAHYGGAENASLENAELENAAPNCRTGKRENGLVMESRSILNNQTTNTLPDVTLIPRLHDTAGCTTGLTTVLNEQPLFVQPFVQHG